MSRAARTARTARIGATAIAMTVGAVVLAGPASATWSVVGTDPATGQVGAAVASCTEVRDLTTTMALVPNVGGAVSLDAVATGPVLMASALQSGAAPADVRAGVIAGASSSADAAARSTVAVAGKGTAGGSATADRTATVQGTGLASPAVLAATRTGFDTATGPFSSRLLAALDAGAAAGGDRSCGGTARSAAVVVVDADSKVFVPAAKARPADVSDLVGATDLTPAQLADRLAERATLPAPLGVGAPTTYMSSVVASDGDAIAVLKDRQAAQAKAAAARTVPTTPIIDPTYSEGLTLAALIAFCVLGLIVAALIIAGLRRSDRRAQELAGTDPSATGAARRTPFRGEVAQLFDVDLAATIRRSREAERRRQLQKDLERGRERDRVRTGSW